MPWRYKRQRCRGGGASKIGSKACMERSELGSPTDHVVDGCLRSDRCAMVLLLHGFLLTCVTFNERYFSVSKCGCSVFRLSPFLPGTHRALSVFLPSAFCLHLIGYFCADGTRKHSCEVVLQLQIHTVCRPCERREHSTR